MILSHISLSPSPALVPLSLSLSGPQIISPSQRLADYNGRVVQSSEEQMNPVQWRPLIGRDASVHARVVSKAHELFFMHVIG